MTRDTLLIAVILAVQAVCAVFFVSDIVLTVLGARSQPIAWQVREYLEIGAALGLVLGFVLGALALRRTLSQKAAAEARLRVASGVFMDHVTERLDEWGLTPAERDVALFLLKGLGTADVARLRETSEGMVKAQTNAIYRKAGVANRGQLVSLFIEDLVAPDGPVLLDEPAPPRAAAR